MILDLAEIIGQGMLLGLSAWGLGFFIYAQYRAFKSVID